MASALDIGISPGKSTRWDNASSADSYGSSVSMNPGNYADSLMNRPFISGYQNVVDSVKHNVSAVKSMVGNSMSAALASGKDISSSEIDYSGYSGGGASAPTPATPQIIDYLDAPLAEHYGMDAATAYQEALANNAVQRRMADLKAAGLNPVLGVSGAGASSFYGVSAAADSGVSSTGGRGFGSLSSSNDVSDIATKLGYFIPQAVGAIAGAATLVKVKNPYLRVPMAQAVSQFASNSASSVLSGIRNISDLGR